jgi:hypothetical protein
MLRRMWPVYGGVLEEHLVPGLGDGEAKAVAAGLARVSDSVGGAILRP